MQIIITLIIGVLVSGVAWGQADYSSDFVLSAGAGKVEIDNLEGSENIYSASMALDFHSVPIEFEFGYSYVDWNPNVQFVGAINESVDVDGAIEHIGITGKLDLSWTCRAACLYVLAGYGTAELSVDDIDTGTVVVEDFSIEGDFAHWGAGARYDFRSGLRASLEYVVYKIGEQEGFDFGDANAWQAGIGYRF